MKKILTYFILLFITVINICCTQSSNKQDEENVVYEDKYTLKDYVNKNFRIYKPKENIYHLLDNVISNINNCSVFLNKQIGYTVQVDSIYTPVHILICGYDYKDIELLSYNTNIMFFYKGYKFLYFGYFLNTYFTDTNNVEEHNCIKPLDVKPNDTYIDDSLYHFLSWEYIYTDNNFMNISYSCCGNHFIDTNYIKTERW